MSGDVPATKQSFEERMLERIRDSVGELMTDDELKKILERGVEKALFTGRQRTDSWGQGLIPQ